MNTLAIITKIELKKLFQRKDSWLMFTILLVPILYSVGLASNSDVITYTGAGNITAIGFASAMFQMSQSMFIFNVILSAIVGRSLASEIENKSIRLYVNRIGVRKLIYGGKELALLIFSVFIDILLVLTSIAFYYAVLIHNPKVASGIFYDSNVGMEIVQIVCNCIFWLITIFLVMLMATKLKTLVCVGVYTDAPYLTVRRAWHTEHNRPVILTELKTKAAERNIPLPDRLAECLREAKKKSTSDYIIANQDGEPLSYTQFKRLWQYIVTRTAKPRIARKLVDGKYVKYMLYPELGEKARNNGHVVYSLDFDVTPHMLRHTYITNLIHASVDPKTVQYLAGHESSKITMDIYAKVKYNKPEQLAGVLSGAFAEWDGGEYEAAQ